MLLRVLRSRESTGCIPTSVKAQIELAGHVVDAVAAGRRGSTTLVRVLYDGVEMCVIFVTASTRKEGDTRVSRPEIMCNEANVHVKSHFQVALPFAFLYAAFARHTGVEFEHLWGWGFDLSHYSYVYRTTVLRACQDAQRHHDATATPCYAAFDATVCALRQEPHRISYIFSEAKHVAPR